MVEGSFDNDPYYTAIGVSLFGNAAPNLAIKAGSISLSNFTPQVGETVQVTFTLINYGDVDATDVSVNVYKCDEVGTGSPLNAAPVVVPTVASRGETVSASPMLSKPPPDGSSGNLSAG